jgi:hypothetical protein
MGQRVHISGFRCKFEHKTSDIADLSVEMLAKRQLAIERRLCNYIHHLAHGTLSGVWNGLHHQGPINSTHIVLFSLLFALEITNGDLIYRKAQERYGFPKSTLQRYMLNGTKTAYRTKCKLTEMEFETIAEKCRANFIGNQQTTVLSYAEAIRGGGHCCPLSNVAKLLPFRSLHQRPHPSLKR